MAAALLAPGATTLSSVPAILDVSIMAELLRRLGCDVVHDVEGGTVRIDVPERPGHRADYELVRAMRASISVLGPLTARLGIADVAVPGGDAIGSRGLDLHAAGLRTLGATVHVDHGYLVAEAPDGLVGAPVQAGVPLGRRHRERADGLGAGPRHHGHRQRGARAGDRRPRHHAGRDGCRDRGCRHLDARRHRRRAGCTRSSTPSSQTASPPAPGRSPPR
ncbi:hypothetical protein GCM10025868_38790 [Angustibacter aerolatus]|uniref:UDP-N-acetylglucosamine 1-carboxyvinyltransferase n=1 Tax=Angustibacter aerolatus TaxID=1162965 RepID=A0ABQ6JMS6_9ACTN|nr:hypothetical protein [Angustibacter aerolatus]GMA88629.1 hypothetical protein GCM10025868_38790 [Angustibacter aerolatus]